MSTLSIVTLFCLLFVSIKAIPQSKEKAGIVIPDKPKGVFIQDSYQFVYPGPADLSMVFSKAFYQKVGGIGTSLHAIVDYLTRLVGA